MSFEGWLIVSRRPAINLQSPEASTYRFAKIAGDVTSRAREPRRALVIFFKMTSQLEVRLKKFDVTSDATFPIRYLRQRMLYRCGTESKTEVGTRETRFLTRDPRLLLFTHHY